MRAATCNTGLGVMPSTSSRITALTSRKLPAAIASRIGVALSVASHSTLGPETTTAARNRITASARGTASIEKIVITSDCSVPRIFNWLRNTPSAAPKAAPEKVQPNQSSWINSSSGIPTRSSNRATSQRTIHDRPRKAKEPPALIASVQA